MSFSAGTFSINSSGQPVVSGTTISASVFNALTADLATGLSTCMLKDGTQTATAGIGFYAGTVSLPGIYFGTDTSTGLYRIGLNDVGFAVSGVKLMQMSGTTLDVAGLIEGAGAYYGNGGSIGAGTNHFRTDAQAEWYGATDSLISLMQGANPGVTTYETAVAFGARDSAGAIHKTSSISSKWADATAGTGWSVLRLNATYAGGVTDDVAIRIFGDVGVDIFGGSDTVGPGSKIFRVNGTITSTIGITNTQAVTAEIQNVATGAGSSSRIYSTAPSDGTGFFIFRNGTTVTNKGYVGYDFATETLTLSANGTAFLSGLSTGIAITGYVEGAEQAAPAAPAANGYRIFAQDNGGGKTQLMVIFSSGAAQQLAIQP